MIATSFAAIPISSKLIYDEYHDDEPMKMIDRFKKKTKKPNKPAQKKLYLDWLCYLSII